MPRKEYRTITIKVETFQKFLRIMQEAKKSNPELDNSKFVDFLLEKYKKGIVSRKPSVSSLRAL